MSTVDDSTNPQIQHDTPETKQQKIDKIADSMASKAGNVEHKSETSDTVGGVRSNSGGLFTK